MSKEWKIYTRTGDKGETSLIGGSRVPKFHHRVEAYGTLDELNSFVGYLRDQIEDEHIKSILLEIQERVFSAESLLAVDSLPVSPSRIPILYEEDVQLLENEMDSMNTQLPEITTFILPGGHPLVSLCHVCRTVCRRAERHTDKVSSIENNVDEIVVRYLNRLSDYFFVLSRKVAHDHQVPDMKWRPRLL